MIKQLFYTTRDELLDGALRNVWNHLESQSFSRRKLGRQWFMYINAEAFAAIQHHFTAEPLRQGHWRSAGALVHLHAVHETPNCINVHIDFLNPSRNPLLMLGHFFTDVLPTSIWASCAQRRLVLRPFYQPD